MLTGRSYDAEEGQAIGISHYLVAPGEGLAKGIELAKRIAGNAPTTNFAVTQVLPRIAQSDPAAGYLTEALISATSSCDSNSTRRKATKSFAEPCAATCLVSPAPIAKLFAISWKYCMPISLPVRCNR